MYVQFGDHAHALGEAEFIVEQEPLRGENQIRYGNTITVTINGMLEGSSIDAITTAINAMMDAYAADYQDLGLYEDDGTPTAHCWSSKNDTLNGIRVIKGPNFPSGKGAEYATYRTYSIKLQFEVGNEGADGGEEQKSLEWSQSLEFSGGGSKWLYIESRNGAPQRQQVTAKTTYRAVQSGRATGQLSQPSAPGPIWPEFEHREQRVINYSAPKLDGTAYREYGISWRYVFESAGPLSGSPGLPPKR